MELIELPVNKINPYEKNPRKNDGAVEAVSGYIISERAAAERANTMNWTLSEREKEIIKSLDK